MDIGDLAAKVVRFLAEPAKPAITTFYIPLARPVSPINSDGKSSGSNSKSSGIEILALGFEAHTSAEAAGMAESLAGQYSVIHDGKQVVYEIPSDSLAGAPTLVNSYGKALVLGSGKVQNRYS